MLLLILKWILILYQFFVLDYEGYFFLIASSVKG